MHGLHRPIDSGSFSPGACRKFMTISAATVYAVSGAAFASNAAGTVRPLRSGDEVLPDESVSCREHSWVMLSDQRTGEVWTIGPEADGPARVGDPNQNLGDDHMFEGTGMIDATGLNSLAARTNLFIASGRASAALEELLGTDQENRTETLDHGLQVSEDAVQALIELLEAGVDTGAATDTFLQSGSPAAQAPAMGAPQLASLREQIKLLESGDQQPWRSEAERSELLEEIFASAFKAIEQAESRLLEAYAREVPGGPAWSGNGETMRFNPAIGEGIALESAETGMPAQQVTEALALDEVLSSVTEHQLEEVLSFDREGGQLRVSVQSDPVTHEAEPAILLDSQLVAIETSQWAYGLQPGSAGTDAGQG